jgi:hypothetical protein
MPERTLHWTAGRIITLNCIIAMCLLSAPVISSGQTFSSIAVNETSEHTVNGHAVDDLTGGPLSGVEVRLQTVVLHTHCENCPPQPPPPLRKTITGADGKFSFDNVPTGNVSIEASKDGYVSAWAIHRKPDESFGMYLVNDQLGPITQRLAPKASISGSFRDHNGAPILEGAGVVLWHLRSWAGWPRLEYGGFASFDKDGTYHFADLLPGRYYLTANPPTARMTPESNPSGKAVAEVPMRYPEPTPQDTNPFFTLREGEHANVTFQFPQATVHRVSGLIKADQSYSFNIVDANGNNSYPMKTPPFNKQFETWLPNGSYRLSTGREGEISGDQPFEVSDSDLLNLFFSIAPQRIEIPVEISNVAANAALCPEQPAACFFFSIRMVRFDDRGSVEVVNEVTSTGRSEGSPPMRIESASLIPGNYTLVANFSGNLYAKTVTSGATDLATEPLVVNPGDAPAPIRILVASGAVIDGVVRSDDKPVRAFVYVIPENIETKNDFREFQPVMSEQNGHFKISGLAPGTYLLFATDTELEINIHDPTEATYWRSRGSLIHLEAEKSSEVSLNLTTLRDIR